MNSRQADTLPIFNEYGTQPFGQADSQWSACQSVSVVANRWPVGSLVVSLSIIHFAR